MSPFSTIAAIRFSLPKTHSEPASGGATPGAPMPLD
jgi:hypothetical protein